MIELRKIRKIYKSGRGECLALDRLSFVLPDRGMVFILGKSGSGKSTLLNVMGGLDSATEGEVLVDGNPLSRFSPAEQDHYRNLYVGFIFQDFCLLDGLSVRDNVRLSLDLLGEEDDGAALRRLAEVGLGAEAARYPRQLSGGQCQRVAIARALAKSPRMLLADEPTGNLDSRTAVQILDILKVLSRDHLVVVVSHNAADAERYGDRIIELGDGRIIRDVERSEAQDAPLIADGVITLPRGRALTDEDLAAINQKITEDGVRVTQAAEPFAPTRPMPSHAHRALGKPKRMRPSASLRLSRFFARGGYLGTAVTAAILTVLVLLLCFAQAFALFDSRALIRDALESSDDACFALHKGYYGDILLDKSLKTNLAVPISEEEIAAFYAAGYTGNVYRLYTTPILFSSSGGSDFERGELENTALEYTSPYAKSGNGVLKTDPEFLIKLYGRDGALSLLAGEITPEANERGVLLPDYAADCILHHSKIAVKPGQSPYQALVDAGTLPSRINVSAVFETGYRERYAELFASYEALEALTGDARREALNAILASDLFSAFSTEVDKYLAIGYFIGEDYWTSATTKGAVSTLPRFHNTDVLSTDGEMLFKDTGWMYTPGSTLAPGEAVIGANVFNMMFGTSYTAASHEGFTPVEVEFVGYENGAHTDAEPLYRIKVTIVGLSQKDEVGPSFHIDAFKQMYAYSFYPYALYFDNAEGAAALYDLGEDMGFYTSSLYMKSVYTVKGIVEIFRSVFVYVGLAIALVAFLLIVSFALRGLRRRRREIGILRALGGRTGRIVRCFSLQVVLLGGAVAALSLIALPFLADTANTVLVDNMAEFLANPAIRGLTLLTITPRALLIVMAVLLPVLLLSTAVPLLFIRRLKPMKIIRSARE